MRGDPIAFVREHTAPAAPPLVPEIALHLATAVTPLWQATEAILGGDGLDAPYWAFAWPGGQALARHLFDRPELVRGLSVLDLGAGSGLVAIAAARAGAARVAASDTDPLAAVAIGLNAELNGVAIDVVRDDLTDGGATDWDVVTAGDVCYERDMAGRVLAWLRRVAAGGAEVLLADPGRSYRPRDGLDELARYDVPTTRELEDGERKTAVVWRVSAA